MISQDELRKLVKPLVRACQDDVYGVPERITIHTTRYGEHPVQVAWRDLDAPEAYLVRWSEQTDGGPGSPGAEPVSPERT